MKKELQEVLYELLDGWGHGEQQARSVGPCVEEAMRASAEHMAVLLKGPWYRAVNATTVDQCVTAGIAAMVEKS